MKKSNQFILAMIAVVLLSAALAPLLFQILPYKFERIFNRLIMIGTLAAVVLFIRIDRESLKRIGLYRDQQSLRYLTAGFFAAFTILTVMTGVKIQLGFIEWNLQLTSLWGVIVKVIYLVFTGLLIGVIEEFFFRGAVFRLLNDKYKLNLAVSILVTNLFYSLVHFVNYRKEFIGPEPGFMDSLSLVLLPFINLKHFPLFWNEALGLFFFGILLNYFAVRTKSLYSSIGLHAGCVFFVKMDGAFFNDVSPNAYLWASNKMYDGLLGWFFIAIMGMFLSLMIRNLSNARAST